MYGLTVQDIHLIHQVLKKYPQVCEALIFGSRAMGNFKPGSDVDIALKGDLSEEIVSKVSVELNERLPIPYKLDVLGYSLIDNQDLRVHIDTYGKLLYPSG